MKIVLTLEIKRSTTKKKSPTPKTKAPSKSSKTEITITQN